MKFLAEVQIMPHTELLDPQGKAVNQGLEKLGMSGVSNVRIGKTIKFHVDADSGDAANEVVKNACEKLLVNKIMEQYTFNISQVE